jgi:hypothetical protein
MILQYTRNDILSLQMTLPVQVQRKSNVYENPWAETLSANRHPGSNGTLWVLNTGAHIHNTSEYRGFIDTLIEQWYPTAAIEHPDDLFFFRTTVPGHANCSLHSKPFRTLRDYAESIKTGTEWIRRHRGFRWDLFAGFNQYVSKRVKGTTIQLLDVNPMTVLRPDGHRPPKDCLHYYLPGVVDWWNHLLVTQLVRPPFGGSAADAPNEGVKEGPLISLIVPAIPRDLLAGFPCMYRALNAQSVLPYEVVVVLTNVSTADCKTAADEAAKHVSERLTRITRVHCVVELHNQASARNIGINISRGNWLSFVDADDALVPTYFRRLVRHIQAQPELLLYVHASSSSMEAQLSPKAGRTLDGAEMYAMSKDTSKGHHPWVGAGWMHSQASVKKTTGHQLMFREGPEYFRSEDSWFVRDTINRIGAHQEKAMMFDPGELSWYTPNQFQHCRAGSLGDAWDMRCCCKGCTTSGGDDDAGRDPSVDAPVLTKQVIALDRQEEEGTASKLSSSGADSVLDDGGDIRQPKQDMPSRMSDHTFGETWNDYRLGDIVKREYPGEGPDTMGVACSKFPASIGCAYETQTSLKGDIATLVKAVQEREQADVPAPKAILVHLRVGDGIKGPDCWHKAGDCFAYPSGGETYLYALSEAYYTGLVRMPLASDGFHIEIVGAPGHNISKWNRSYLHDAIKYFEAKGYKVILRGVHDPDTDFTYMARAVTFVQGGGGYSGLVAQIVAKTKGAVVLRSGSTCTPNKLLCRRENT